MTSRERLLNLLNGEKVDRLPVAPFIHNNFIYEFFDDEKTDTVERGMEVYCHFGFDTVLRTCTVWDMFDIDEQGDANWKVVKEKHTRAEDAEWSVTTRIATPEKELRQIKQYRRVGKYEVVSANAEYFIKDESDFEQFVKYQPTVREYDCSVVTRAKKLIGEAGLTAPWAQGAFNSLREYRRMDDLLADPYINPEMYERMIGYFSERMLKMIAQLARAGADIISCEGNAATGSMVGPAYFKKYVLPYETEFAGKVKQMGVYYLYHNCGDARALLDLYSGIGMDIYETLTPPPYGDTMLEEALRKIGPNITLSGNIDQITFLMESTPEEIEIRVKELCQTVSERGNFILATSDYLSSGTPHENVSALSDAAKKYGVIG